MGHRKRGWVAAAVAAGTLTALLSGCGGSDGSVTPAGAAAVAACAAAARTPLHPQPRDLGPKFLNRLGGAGSLGQAAAGEDPLHYGNLEGPSRALLNGAEQSAQLGAAERQMATACRADAQPYDTSGQGDDATLDATSACTLLTVAPAKTPTGRAAEDDEHLLGGAASLGLAGAEEAARYENLQAPMKALLDQTFGVRPHQPLSAATSACAADRLPH